MHRCPIHVDCYDTERNPKSLNVGFDWKSLPEGSIVVDVAGGVGTQTVFLAKEFDHLKFIVQDRAPVIENDAPKVLPLMRPSRISVTDQYLYLVLGSRTPGGCCFWSRSAARSVRCAHKRTQNKC